MGGHLTAIGTIRSPRTDPAAAPKQGDEGSPEATIVLEPAVLWPAWTWWCGAGGRASAGTYERDCASERA